jgi:uncharacterized membrane protein affecting hemolysin expression
MSSLRRDRPLLSAKSNPKTWVNQVIERAMTKKATSGFLRIQFRMIMPKQRS